MKTYHDGRSSWRTGRTTAERGYGGRWQRARKRHLAKHPLCETCEKLGRVTLATIVDHRIPHQGDPALFWEEPNWQSLCATHHNSDKQAEERSGRKRLAFDADGHVIW